MEFEVMTDGMRNFLISIRITLTAIPVFFAPSIGVIFWSSTVLRVAGIGEISAAVPKKKKMDPHLSTLAGRQHDRCAWTFDRAS